MINEVILEVKEEHDYFGSNNSIKEINDEEIVIDIDDILVVKMVLICIVGCP